MNESILELWERYFIDNGHSKERAHELAVGVLGEKEEDKR